MERLRDGGLKLSIGQRGMVLLKPITASVDDGDETRVKVFGIIKYIGTTKFADGEWVGLLLDEEFKKYAKNNGSVKGIKYFETGDEIRGLFVKSQGVRVIADYDNENVAFLLEEKKRIVEEINEIQSRLEVSEVEREVLNESNAKLEADIIELKLQLKSFKELKADGVKINFDSVNLKKIEIQLNESKEAWNKKEIQLNDHIDELQLEIDEVYKTLEMLETELEVTKKNLLEYQIHNKQLMEELELLEPQSTEEIIEKLTEKITTYSIEIQNLQDVIKDFHVKDSQRSSLEEEYALAMEGLNNTILELEDQLSTEISKCMSLEERLHSSAEIIKSLKLEKSNTPQVIANNFLFSNLLKTTDQVFCDLIKDMKLNTDSILLLKKLVNVNEIANRMQNHSTDVENQTKWSQLVDISSIYIQVVLNYHGNIITSAILKADFFLNKFSVFLEETDGISLIEHMDAPFHWSDNEYSDLENSIINRERLIYICNDNLQLTNLRINNQGIIANDYFNDLMKTSGAQIDDINFEKLKIIGDKKQEKKANVNLEADLYKDEIEALKHKIQILETKLQDEENMQRKLYELNGQLDNEHLQTDALNMKIETIKRLQSETSENYQKAKSLLKKFGIQSNSQKEIIIDDLSVVENIKLLDVIKTQREIIYNLLNKEQSQLLDDLGWLTQWPQGYKQKQPRYFDRIEMLFDINLKTGTNVTLHEQAIWGYLCR